MSNRHTGEAGARSPRGLEPSARSSRFAGRFGVVAGSCDRPAAPRVVVGMGRDGATSREAFRVACTFAGARRLRPNRGRPALRSRCAGACKPPQSRDSTRLCRITPHRSCDTCVTSTRGAPPSAPPGRGVREDGWGVEVPSRWNGLVVAHVRTPLVGWAALCAHRRRRQVDTLHDPRRRPCARTPPLHAMRARRPSGWNARIVRQSSSAGPHARSSVRPLLQATS
jgi:hypothetical protein